MRCWKPVSSMSGPPTSSQYERSEGMELERTFLENALGVSWSQSFPRSRDWMSAPCVRMSEEPSIVTPWEHDLCPLPLWDTLNCAWLWPKTFQEEELGCPAANPLTMERRLSWGSALTVSQCRSLLSMRKMWSKPGLTQEDCLERGSDGNSDQPEMMQNAGKQRSVQWRAGEERLTAC